MRDGRARGVRGGPVTGQGLAFLNETCAEEVGGTARMIPRDGPIVSARLRSLALVIAAALHVALITSAHAARVGPRLPTHREDRVERGDVAEFVRLAQTRYGGTADLCGIGPADARDNVVMRFAVVHRERLVAGLL